MPTPVSVARQCLTEEAAAALDDAVAVAKRRSHGQTTSLHAVSALLAIPSSTLRDACTRARSNAYSPRLQFRALELCLGVALDRISMSKSVVDEPPVSNSLMAAIKRGQANQRRHPETFHLYQQQMNANGQSSSSVTVVRVEMKHFIISILDDPIVSRVFGDAGFRTNEIKMAILSPLTMSRFSLGASRCPPLFMCSLSDLERREYPTFPFPGVEKIDDNSRRIGGILVNRKRRNPLLIGGCASEALRNFIDCINRGETGVLPKEIEGLSVVPIENEISEFANGTLSEETMVLKLKQVGQMVQNCQGPGVIVNCGDWKVFVDSASLNVGNSVVSELKRLLVEAGGKLWLIGFLAEDADYRILAEGFPSIEMDWDLHLLPITTSKSSSIGGKYFKSSLMGSFVPFGGFFSNPSELETLCTNTQSSSLCSLCNDEYEQEASIILKGERSDSVTDKKPEFPSWLQTAESGIGKRLDTVKAKDDKSVLDARVVSLRRKWSDICQRFHCSSTSQDDILQPRSQTAPVVYFQDPPVRENAANVVCSSHGSRISNTIGCFSSHLQKNTLPDQETPQPVSLSVCANRPVETPVRNSEMRGDNVVGSSFSAVSVTTDLGLGSLYTSLNDCRRQPNFQEHPVDARVRFETFRTLNNTGAQVATSSSCANELDKQIYTKDSEKPWKLLVEKLSWQIEAIQTVSRTISRCRTGDGRYHGSNNGNIWFSFLGPDNMGKRKMAVALAEIVFGGKDELLVLDLSLKDCSKAFDPFVDCQKKYQDLKSGRKLIVDYVAEELSKCRQCIVLLENIEQADAILQYSLSQAIRTGKFPNSYGRDINVRNVVFVLSSSVLKVREDLHFVDGACEYPEEKILEARKLQMQILVGSADGSYSRNSMMNVSVTPSKIILDESPVKKRKLTNDDPTEILKHNWQSSRSIIDLNLPVVDTEEDRNLDKCSDDDAEDRSESSEVWVKELLEHVDENVVFKPFDFDSLAQKILKEIDTRLKKVVGAKNFLEIDREVMVQILAASWLSDRKNALEDWIDQVLCPSIDKARQKHAFASEFLMKLVPCHGLVAEDQAYGICLPSRIYVN